MSSAILDINNLHLVHTGMTGRNEILHGISLHINQGERVALVGESGSGKSMTARLILGLLNNMRGMEFHGSVKFENTELGNLNFVQRRKLRGTRMSMIFQDPTAALNPMFTIESQFLDVLRRVQPTITLDEATKRITQLLSEVALKEPARVLASYPFQLSGGMNQRVMIAMALANNPTLLIADEPGTALDVSVQAQTLQLMRNLVTSHGTAVLFISHNLGVVREFADRIYVIYLGRIVEHGSTQQIFSNPQHPYTQDLLAAVPRITGGGLPELAAREFDYEQPCVSHAVEPSI